MAFAKIWYVTRCDKHGQKPKGQNFGEVRVPAPKKGSKGLGRHRTECPLCRAERLKEAKETAE